MENGLVTGDGTKVLTVEEYDKFIQAIPESKRAIFEINTITGLRYVELQRLYDKPPERSSWNRDLARWSLKAGIIPKVGNRTSRKTIESWMLKSGIPEIEIYSRQGHDPITSLKHYQSLSFTDYEMRDIEKRLIEWGILRRRI
ncbi:MAG: site-specific integrase [Alphaproteobacteria bacterium]|nr:MAG: site-specific integrase [Alphaproteobacteria bacterium]